MKSTEGSVGITLLTIFFTAGSLICAVIILALAFPGSFLDPIWRLKPEARLQFLQIGRSGSIILMTLVGAACELSAIGLARNTNWDERSPSAFYSSISLEIH